MLSPSCALLSAVERAAPLAGLKVVSRKRDSRASNIERFSLFIESALSKSERAALRAVVGVDHEVVVAVDQAVEVEIAVDEAEGAARLPGVGIDGEIVVA